MVGFGQGYQNQAKTDYNWLKWAETYRDQKFQLVSDCWAEKLQSANHGTQDGCETEVSLELEHLNLPC